MSQSKTSQIIRRSIVSTVILTAAAVAKQPAAPHSQWVYLDHSGKLFYSHFKVGDKILDFSYAGYMGGGVAIPTVQVKKIVLPSGNDDTAAIQAAVDEVSALPLVNGSRGAVLLKSGHFHCSAPLKIVASGVVLRGSGTGNSGTTINLSGDPHLGIIIAGASSIVPIGAPTIIADADVPSGAMSFSVQDVSGLKPGDTIQITRPVTSEWLHFMGMDALMTHGRNLGLWQPHHPAHHRLHLRQYAPSHVPLADSYDAKYLAPDGASVVKIKRTGQIEQVGVENLRIVAPALKSTLSGGTSMLFR